MSRNNEVDPDEIHDFIEVVSRARPGGGARHHVPVAPDSYSSYSMYPPSLSLSESSNQVSHRRKASESSNGTVISSIFSEGYTTSSASEPPLRHGPDAGRRPEVLPAMHPRTFILPCEFDGEYRCDFGFSLQDVDGWIHHISKDHLRYRYPSRSRCWFCPQRFIAEYGNERAVFETRLRHIYQHFWENDIETDRRPDRYLFEHLSQLEINDRQAPRHDPNYYAVPQPRPSRSRLPGEAEWAPRRERHRVLSGGRRVQIP